MNIGAGGKRKYFAAHWRAGFVLALLLPAIASTYWPIPGEELAFHDVQSLRIVDRRGTVLREVLSPAQGYGRWTPLPEISAAFLDAIMAVEDRHFRRHHGVSLAAIGRALWQNFRAGRIVSGGSTITQQLVRQLYPIRSNIPDKLYEMWLALRLEHTLSKDEILAQYVNRVPFGNLTYGIEAASQFYFGRPAAHLSLAQAAFLAGLPQAPSHMNPLRHFARAKQRQQRVLQAMLRSGKINRTTLQAAAEQDISPEPVRRRFLAPHATEMVLAALQQMTVQNRPGVLRLTLDAELQQRIRGIVRSEIAGLRRANVNNAAVIVIDNRNGEILALLGSADFFSQRLHGQVNGVLALRQPGSALKPFTYLLALENGYSPASLLPDIPLHAPGTEASGDFSPSNYDGKFHGPVRLRTALACSYNVPPVYLLQRLGVPLLLRKLRRAGFTSLSRNAGHYGLGLTLGNGEVRLLELARAYSGLARGGELPALSLVAGEPAVLPPEMRTTQRFAAVDAARLITDILSDQVERIPAFGEDSPLALPFPCAAKTGTTKDYRDNWTVGYTTKYTVGVWVGNFDGSAMRHVSGVSGAGPIFRDVMLALHPPKFRGADLSFPSPAEAKRLEICALSGALPRPFCPERKTELFLSGTAPQAPCELHTVLTNPKNGEQEIAVVYPPEYEQWLEGLGIQPPVFLGKYYPPGAAAPHPVMAAQQDIRITFPDSGDVFKMDPVLREAFQHIRLAATAPERLENLTWFVDGHPLVTAPRPRSFAAHWQLQAGEHVLSLRKNAEARRDLARVRIRVLP